MLRSSRRELKELTGKRRFTRADRIAVLVTILVLAPLAVLFAYPFFWMVTDSVKSNVEIFGSLNPFTSTLRLTNYINAWNDSISWRRAARPSRTPTARPPPACPHASRC